MIDNIGKVKCIKIKNEKALIKVEKDYRMQNAYEIIPYAKDTSYSEVSKIVSDKGGPWKHSLSLYISEHRTNIGAQKLCVSAHTYMLQQSEENNGIDILSIAASIQDGVLILQMLIRPYETEPNMQDFFEYIGETDFIKQRIAASKKKGELRVPTSLKNFQFSEEEIIEHQKEYNKQKIFLENSSEEKPFLNMITHYVPQKLVNPLDYYPLTYDLRTKDELTSTISTYEKFIEMFEITIQHINDIEFNQYIDVLRHNNPEEEKSFLKNVEAYIIKTYTGSSSKMQFPKEDIPALMNKVHNALFKLYVVQDLIDDPDVSDVKITAPDEIRPRIKGKAYLSNITFLNEADYYRFIVGICIRNRIDMRIPSQTFTYDFDDNYVLRFTLSADYTNAVPWPYLHIRKVNRKKLLGDGLIEAGMMDEILKDYLLDCGRHARGVIFEGPPGSGKTVALNWFLEEAYEDSAEILVIQESDELFTERKGVMIKHTVSNPKEGEQICTLEDLGKIALVEGCNVFIIGEVKGAEICSAITLSNSGCRTALTLHSNSSLDAIDKMADLAMRGYAKSYEEAKRMLKSFQIIVHLEDFKIQEITEIMGYDEMKKDMIYRPIYRRAKK